MASGCTQGWEDEGGAGLEPTHLGAQGSHHQYEGASNGLGPKGHLKAMRAGTWEAWHIEEMRRFKPTSQACKLDMCCPSSPVEVMETRTYLMYHCSSIALFRLHLLQCFHMVSCLCHVLTNEQLTWFD
jgi:hypothetical protein